MPSHMHADWARAKEGLKKQISDVKQNGGLNPKQIQDALKTFDGGLGPALDSMEAAYKANKGADVQKYANKAEGIADTYLKSLEGISNMRGTGAAITLKAIKSKLAEIKQKGMTANPAYFK